MQNTIQPNTTQVPNIILDEWMPRLSDAEFRVLLVVVRQTLGWIEDKETKRRKEKDWISHSQLARKTGKGTASITRAIKILITEHNLIEAIDSKGKLLDTAVKRTKMGPGGKIFYRLNVHAPQITLFDKAKKGNQNDEARQMPHQKKDPQNDALQKKPLYTKESIHTMQPDKPVATPKEKSDHAKFVAFWDETVKRTRGIEKPIYTGADMRNLKRILNFGIPEQTLEQIALFFLADFSFRAFSPSISTFTSSGIINGLLNKSRRGNDPEFWKNMSRYMDQYLPKKTEAAPEVRRIYDPEDQNTFSSMTSMADAMKKMLDGYHLNTLEKTPA